MQALINDGDSILLETPVYPYVVSLVRRIKLMSQNRGTLGILIPESADLVGSLAFLEVRDSR